MLLLEHTAAQQRQTKIAGQGESTALQTVSNAVACLCLPMDDRAAVQQGFTVGQAYDVFFADGQDIKKGDRLTVNGLVLYVSGVQRFVGLGADVNHVKALCEVKNV
jgi:hypothetical protein